MLVNDTSDKEESRICAEIIRFREEKTYFTVYIVRFRYGFQIVPPQWAGYLTLLYALF